jgi:formate dehydrogenase maturation protein FdhE
MASENIAKQVRRLLRLEKCPKCGSTNISSDVDLDEDFNVVREYDFCFDCGAEWNERKIEKK